MKRKQWLMAFAAVLLVLGMGVGSASAYFTTYVSAEGGKTIHLGDSTTIRDDFYDWTKHVRISCDEDSVPVFVRAKAFSGNQYPLEYNGNGNKKWQKGDGEYWYYSEVLNASEETEELWVRITEIPEGTDVNEINVVVIYECTPALYDEDGKPYADWTTPLDVGEGGSK